MLVPQIKEHAENIIICTVQRELLSSLFKEYNISITEQFLNEAVDSYFTASGLDEASYVQIKESLSAGDDGKKEKIPSTLKEMKNFSEEGILFDLMTWKLYYKITAQAQITESDIKKYQQDKFSGQVLDEKLQNEIVELLKGDFFCKFRSGKIKDSIIELPSEYATIEVNQPLEKSFLPDDILRKIKKKYSGKND